MKTHRTLYWLAGILLAGILISGAHADGLTVTDAWIREAPPSAAVHAGYLSLTNSGTHSITVTGVYSPDYDSGEIHNSWVENGVARMEAIERLEIPPGDTIRLEPGGRHLMLFRPQRTLHDGDTVTLRFATASGDCHEFSAAVKRMDAPSHVH